MRERIGPYRIEKVIGKDAMGLVYQARHETLDRRVAIKTLVSTNTLDSAARQRLIHEARAQSLLQHENIAAVYECIPEDGELFLAMEYVEGETLAALLERSPNGRLEPAAALPLITQVLKALEEVDRAKIPHRDIHPSNVLIVNDVVKLTGLGIASLDGAPGLTVDPQGTGTPEYMSPEQLQGRDVDARSDIYSAGVLLYTMLVGHSPFPAREPTAAMSQRKVGASDPSRFHPDIPEGIRELLRRALQLQPEDRFVSAAAFRDVLQQMAAGYLRPSFDLQEQITTPVLQEPVVTIDAIAAERKSVPAAIAPWLVIVTSLGAAVYVMVMVHERTSAQVVVSPRPTKAPLPPGPPPLPVDATDPEPPVSSTVGPQPPVTVTTGPEPPITATATQTTEPPDDAERRRMDMIRRETRAAMERAEAALRAERLDEAIEAFQSASRLAHTYPDELAEELRTLDSLYTRIDNAVVHEPLRRLWRTRLAIIEEHLRQEQWPEAEARAEEIVDDPNAPPDIAQSARELHRQARQGRINDVRPTAVGPTESRIRKHSTPPRRNQ